MRFVEGLHIVGVFTLAKIQVPKIPFPQAPYLQNLFPIVSTALFPKKCELAAESPDFRWLTMCCYVDYATENPVFVKKIKTSKMSLFLDYLD